MTHVSASREFVEFVADQLSAMDGVSSRRMFGGAGFFKEGQMFALITADDKLCFKVDDANRGRYEEAGMGPFIPPFKRTMVMPYYEVPSEVMEDREGMVEWAEEAFQAALRAKKPKRAKGR